MDCPQNAITEQIDLLKCNGCGLCVKLCSFGAIRGGLAKVKIRNIDSENVERLRKLEGINVLEKPAEIKNIIPK
jgi:dihydromethanopterin reductase (acceptor)